MKKFLLFFLSLHIAVLSVFAVSSVSHAETLRPDFKKPFWGYFDDIVSTGMNLPTLLKYVGGVLLNDSDSVQAVSLFDDYLVDNSSRFGVNYQTYEEFVDSVLNAEYGVVTITPKGQEIVKEFSKYFVDTTQPYFYVATSVISSQFGFGFSSNDDFQNFKELVNSYNGILFARSSSSTVSFSDLTNPFFKKTTFYLVPSNLYFVGSFPTQPPASLSRGSIQLNSSDNEIDFYGGSLRAYDSNLSLANIYRFNSSNNGVSFSVTDNNGSSYLYYPYINNPNLSTFEFINGFNTSNYPRFYITGTDQSYYYPVSFDTKKIFRVYNSLNDLRDNIALPASYYTTPEYYMPIASNNSVNVTVLNENIYNSTPTYNEVNNYTQTYYQENGDFPSANITYEYITNYYYAGSDNSTSGGDSGGSGGGGIFDFLGDLGSVLGSLISGLGNLVTNLLSALTGVFDSIANVIPDSMNTFFSTFFSWLPPEWISLITLSLTLAVVFGLIKLIRG